MIDDDELDANNNEINFMNDHAVDQKSYNNKFDFFLARHFPMQNISTTNFTTYQRLDNLKIEVFKAKMFGLTPENSTPREAWERAWNRIKQNRNKLGIVDEKK